MVPAGITFRPVRLSLGTRTYDLTTRCLVMGILNRTPDSFDDAGAHFALDAFCRRAEELVAEGADILDVGGVKAGPGPAVAVGEELAFRGAVYAAFDDLGGPPMAIVGSTLMFTAAHVLSHPPVFLLEVAALGLLLATWRWACRDLVAPIVAHSLADLAL